MYNANSMYGNNPYLNNYNYQGVQPNYSQPIQNQMQQVPVTQNFRAAILQGKQIDSLDVVKATDIPLDGSVSYFPLADGSAIATKQLQPDGTSKIVVFKPVNDSENNVEQPKYITESDLKAQIKDFNSKDIKDIKEELKNLKKRIREITDELEEKKEE